MCRVPCLVSSVWILYGLKSTALVSRAEGKFHDPQAMGIHGATVTHPTGLLSLSLQEVAVKSLLQPVFKMRPVFLNTVR